MAVKQMTMSELSALRSGARSNTTTPSVNVSTGGAKVTKMTLADLNKLRTSNIESSKKAEEKVQNVISQFAKANNFTVSPRAMGGEIKAAPEIQDSKKKSTSELELTDTVSDYMPAATTMTRAEYERRRASNPDMPEFGSYDYFKTREESLRPKMTEIANDPDRAMSSLVSMAENYKNDNNWTSEQGPLNMSRDLYEKFSAQDAIIAEYEDIHNQLSKFEKNGVHYTKTGEIDAASGKAEADYISQRLMTIKGAKRLTDDEMVLGYTEELDTEKQAEYDANKARAGESNIERSKAEAYSYYEKHKDNEYADNFGGRTAGNYRVGRTGIKTNTAGKVLFDNYSDDFEAVEVYEALTKRIQENNAGTFTNKNKWEEGLAVISQYAPQGLDQLGLDLIGRGVGVVLGALGAPPGTRELVGNALSADYMYTQTAGASYIRMLRDNGLSAEEAHKIAADEALLSSVVEFGLGWLSDRLWKNAGKAVKGAASETVQTITKKLVSAGLSENAVKTVINVVKNFTKLQLDSLGEGLEEFIQEGLSITADRFAKEGKTANKLELAMAALNFSNYTEEDRDRMTQAFWSGYLISEFGSSVRGASTYISNKVSESANNLDTKKLGEDIISKNNPDIVNAIVKIGLSSESTEIKEIAEKVQRDIESGATPDSNNVGLLTKHAFSEAFAEETQSVETNVNTNNVDTEHNDTPGKKGEKLENSNIVLEQDEMSYPYNQQEVIDGYEDAVDEDIIDFANSIRTMKNQNNASKRSLIVASISERFNNDVRQLTGTNFNGISHILRGSTISHIDERHGENGKADQSMANDNDLARIGWVLENYDNIELAYDKNGNQDFDRENQNSDQSPSPIVKVSKKINGTYFVVEAVPVSSANSAFIKSAYISKNSTEEPSAQLLKNMPDQSPQLTSEPPVEYNEFASRDTQTRWTAHDTNNSISQASGSVKGANIGETLNISALKDTPVNEDSTDTDVNKTLFNIMDELGLTYDEQHAILEYKGAASYSLNYALRNGNQLSAYEQAIKDGVNSALDKFPIYQGVVYRNLGFDTKEELYAFIEQHKGNKVVYTAFTSASKTKDGYPVNMPYIVRCEITSHFARDVSNLGITSENEVLYKSGTSFELTGIALEENTVVIKLKETNYGERGSEQRMEKTGESDQVQENDRSKEFPGKLGKLSDRSSVIRSGSSTYDEVYDGTSDSNQGRIAGRSEQIHLGSDETLRNDGVGKGQALSTLLTENESIETLDIHTLKSTPKDSFGKITPAQIDALRKVSRALGVNIILENGAGGYDGYYDASTRTIHINANSVKPIDTVVRHEIIHFMKREAPKEFLVFRDFIKQKYIEQYGQAALDAYVQNKKNQYKQNVNKDISDDVAYEELCADIGMDMLSTASHVREFVIKHRNPARKLYEYTKRVIHTLGRVFGIDNIDNYSVYEAYIELAKATSADPSIEVDERAIVQRTYDVGFTEDTDALFASLPGGLSLKNFAEGSRLLGLALDSLENAGRKTQGKLRDIANSHMTLDEKKTAHFNELDNNLKAEMDERGGESFSFATPNITANDISALRSIGKKSVNDFTSEDIKKAEPFASRAWKELGAKSPFFRAWFGDWRANDDTLLSVPTINSTAVISSGKEFNRDMNRTISWSKDAAKESILNAPNDVKNEIAVIGANMSEIVRTAVLLDTRVSNNTSKRKMDGSAFMHSLYTIVPLDNKRILIKLFAEEALSNDESTVFTRAYSLKYIKKVAEIDNGVLSENGGLTDSHPATINSISDLFKLVKTYDKGFNPKEPSKIVNADGSPKVMYHGTNADENFTVFDTFGSNFGLFGIGTYFTDNRDVANSYTKKGKGNNPRIYEAYLKADNLIDMDAVADKDKWIEAVSDEDKSDFERYIKDNAISTNEDVFNCLKELCEDNDMYREDAIEYITSVFMNMGYDGITHIGGGRYGKDSGVRHKVVIVFEPTQIKSATDNIGTFDSENPDILYSFSKVDNTIDPQYNVSDNRSAENDIENDICVIPEQTIVFSGSYRSLTRNKTFKTLFEAAKDGDVVSAKKLAKLFITDNFINKFNSKYKDVTIIPVIGKNDTTNNVIPQYVAKHVAKVTGNNYFDGIHKISKNNHKKKSSAARLVSKIDFAFKKSRSKDIEGRHFVIFDDCITTGTTATALRDFIEEHGGIVDGFSSLAKGIDSSDNMAITEEQFDELLNLTGEERKRELSRLTARQAKTLINNKKTRNKLYGDDKVESQNDSATDSSERVYSFSDGYIPAEEASSDIDTGADLQYNVSDKHSAENDIDNEANAEYNKNTLDSVSYEKRYNALSPEEHKYYDAAKKGDTTSAFKLIDNLTKSDKASSVDFSNFDKDVYLLPIVGAEGTSDNILPEYIAKYLSAKHGLKIFSGIYKSAESNSRNQGIWERMKENYPQFEIENELSTSTINGKNFIFVDDNSTTGRTFNGLKNFIEENGGNVAGYYALTVGQDSSEKMTVSEDTWNEAAKIGFDKLKQFAKEEGIKREISKQGLTERECQELINRWKNRRLALSDTGRRKGAAIESTEERRGVRSVSDRDGEKGTLQEVSGLKSTSTENNDMRYSFQDKGENPARDVAVPAYDDNGQPVSRSVRTILESDATPDTFVPGVLREIREGRFSYETISDKNAEKRAKQYIEEREYVDVLKNIVAQSERGSMLDKYEIAILQTLLNQSAEHVEFLSTTDRDGVTYIDKLLGALVSSSRTAGQNLQAQKLIKKMSPLGMNLDIKRLVDDLNREIDTQLGDFVEKKNKRIIDSKQGAKSADTSHRYHKKQKPLVINADLQKQLLEAKTIDEAMKIRDMILEDLGSQVLGTVTDKLRAFRYWAMLSNPRTHVRNMVGNGVNAMQIEMSNLAAAVMQKVFIRDPRLRTKTIIGLNGKRRGDYNDMRLYAGGLFEKYIDFVRGESNRYDEPTVNAFERGRHSFNSKAGKFFEKIGPEFNSQMLEREDMLFLKGRFIREFANAAIARGYKLTDIESGKVSQSEIEALIELSAKQAQEATFRDASWLATKLNELERKNALSGLLVGAVVPFKKTPINILKTGMSYSPFGIISFCGKLAGQTYQKATGKRTSFDTVDLISTASKGIVGTGWFLLGAFLSSLGLLSGGDEDDDELQALKEARGEQNYAITVGDYTLTLDWLTPVNMPLFAGVAFMESLSEDGLGFGDIVPVLSDTINPVLEASMLSGVLDVLDSLSNAESDSERVASLMMSVISSRALQYFPSILAATARTIDEVESRTSVSDPGDQQAFERIFRQAVNKLPILRSLINKPYTDRFGGYNKKRSAGEYLSSLLQNFIIPGYISTVSDTETTEHLMDIYDETGRTDAIPSYVKYFTVNGATRRLTHDELYEYQIRRGELWEEVVSRLMKSKNYTSLDSQTQAELMSKLRELIEKICKYETDSGYNITNKSERAIAEGGGKVEDVLAWLAAKLQAMG